MIKTAIVIPARWASSRLPGKPLAKIGDKPMLQWVIEAAQKTKADDVFVLTDKEMIANLANSCGCKCIIHNTPYKTGTDRILGSIEKFKDYSIIINLQGDEPLIDPDDIDSLITFLSYDSGGYIYTMLTPLRDNEKVDRNCVKAHTTPGSQINMFTRSPIYSDEGNFYKHIGVYGFQSRLLEGLLTIKKQTPNEIGESLEQLRWMDNRIKFKYILTINDHIGIDTPEDLEEINNFIKQSNKKLYNK